VIALLEARRAGLLGRRHWLPNLVAGAVVGVVALPLAMAFAIASGARPEQGLYTAIVAGAAVAAFGGSRVQIAGPTGAFVVILAGITAQHGLAGLQVATLLAGVILVLLGLSGMGTVIRYIPAPVIVGFTAGIGVVIWVGQWSEFLGLPAAHAAHFHQKLWQQLQALPGLHPATTLLAAACLGLQVISPRLPLIRRVPAPLLVLLLATVFQSAFEPQGVRTLGSAFGGIPRELPSFGLPEFSVAQLIPLIGPAFAIAMLGAIESLLSAVIADGMASTRHDSNQELIGQGIANVLAPLLGGFAATGAIARTATNVRQGATSPIAGLVHAAVLVLVIVSLAPLAAGIPLAALASILFVVAWNMSDARRFIAMLRGAPRADVVVLLVTFLLTVFADLVVAVNVGVILATLHFLRRMADSVEVRAATDAELRKELGGEPALPPGALVYSIEGPFFFAAAGSFEQALAAAHADPAALVLRLHRVPFVDATGLQGLEHAIRDLQRRGVRVLLTEANPRVRGKLERAGLLALIGDASHFGELAEAIAALGGPSRPAQPEIREP
jgi:SulP family sulfate permease